MKLSREKSGFGMMLGICVGIALGAALGDIVIGFAIGMAVGGIVGASWPSEEMNEEAIPFTLGSTNLGFMEHQGQFYLEDAHLVFELQSLLGGVEKRDSQVVKIEPEALEYVRLDRGRLSDSIYIKPKKADLLAVVPGKHKEELRLRIPKRHRKQSEDLIGKLRTKLLGQGSE